MLWRPVLLWDIEAPTHFLDSRLSDEGEIFTALRPRRSLPPGSYLVPIYRGWVETRAIVQLEGLGKEENLGEFSHDGISFIPLWDVRQPLIKLLYKYLLPLRRTYRRTAGWKSAGHRLPIAGRLIEEDLLH
jgi:hypothetical protein